MCMTEADTHTALSPPPTRMCVFIKFTSVVWGGMYSKSIALYIIHVHDIVHKDLPLYLGREGRGERGRETGGWLMIVGGGSFVVA